MQRSASSIALMAVMVTVALPSPADAYPRPGRTSRATPGLEGAGGNYASERPSFSGDGRFLVYESFASDLVPDDTNVAWDIFVHSIETGDTERVSVASDGSEANGYSFQATLSEDGRYIAFMSVATNLVPGDTNDLQDVFVHDRETGQTERVSVAPGGGQANNASLDPDISPDGRYVAFYSLASNLVAGDANDRNDIFIHDRQTGAIERVSLPQGGGEANDHSYSPVMSDHLRFVAYESTASNLVAGDANGTRDVFLRDRVSGTTRLISTATGGMQGNQASWAPVISADGRVISFHSLGSNLVPNDLNRLADDFVHDRVTGVTERITVGTDGAEASGCGDSGWSSLSADGRYVAFYSYARNIIPEGTQRSPVLCVPDVFVRDRLTGTTERVAVAGSGAEGNLGGSQPAISPDGRLVAFKSLSSNLVPGDTTRCGGGISCANIYLRDRGPDLGVEDLAAARGPGHVDVTGWATFPGAVLAETQDAPADGGPGAAQTGAELTGASLSLRPEQGTLLARLRVASIPGVRTPATCPTTSLVCGAPAASVGGIPGVVYAFTFEAGATRYEVRVSRAADADTPGFPRYTLHRCSPSCSEIARLTGGYGTTGDEVLVSVPLDAIGMTGGGVLSGLRAWTAYGDVALAERAADEVLLGDARIAMSSVQLGVASPGTPEQEVDFDIDLAPAAGAFAAQVDPPPDGEVVWARACLGSDCSARSVLVS